MTRSEVIVAWLAVVLGLAWAAVSRLLEGVE